MILGNDHLKNKEVTLFYFSILKSLFLHTAIVGLIYLFAMFSISSRSALIAENIQLVESSIRVDMVAMPVHTLQELKAMSEASESPVESAPQQRPSPPAQEETPAQESPAPSSQDFLVEDDSKEPVDDIKEEQVDRSDDNFMEMLRQAGSTEIPRDQDGPERRIDTRTQQRLQDLVMRGNQLSDGVGLVGGDSSEISSEFYRYLQQLPDLVRAHWRIPSYLAQADLQCRVRIYLSQAGRLIRAEVFEPSGNEEYDRRAIEAIRSAAPFPALEESFAIRGTRGDIILGFPL